jgi:hypothetical protein
MNLAKFCSRCGNHKLTVSESENQDFRKVRMKMRIRKLLIALVLGFASLNDLLASDVGRQIDGGSYKTESADRNNAVISPVITKTGVMGVGYIKTRPASLWEYWTYDFDFGDGATTLTVNASSNTKGGTLYVQLGNPNIADPDDPDAHLGLSKSRLTIAKLDIPNTGGWDSPKDFTVNVNRDVLATRFDKWSNSKQPFKLYFVVEQTGDTRYLFNLNSFRFNKERNVSEDPPLVCSNAPDVARSEHYKFRVRGLDEDQWQDAFPFVTKCKPNPAKDSLTGIQDKTKVDNQYFPELSQWSNTYINFEMGSPVVVEIEKTNGKVFQSAVAHPDKQTNVFLKEGGKKVQVIILEPCLFTVDIDGQMDTQHTGKGYEGPAIHTLTIFANPYFDAPLLDKDVRFVRPNEVAPSEGLWKTLFFLPGVHNIKENFAVHANKNYYISHGAVVHGTMINLVSNDGSDIKIFGCGTLSGETIDHPLVDHASDPNLRSPIYIYDAAGTTVQGITIVDSAAHSLKLQSGYVAGKPTTMKWVKIFTWRVNGDGINPMGNGLVENCFIRTQDDALYVKGRGIRGVVIWNDANGSAFVLNLMPNATYLVEDCDVIYTRSKWDKWSGGRVFNIRPSGIGTIGNGVVFKNIRVSDPMPTLATFFFMTQGLELKLKDSNGKVLVDKNGKEQTVGYDLPTKKFMGIVSGLRFENIEIAASSVLKLDKNPLLSELDTLWGSASGVIKNIAFSNVTIGGAKVSRQDHFKRNEFVSDIKFE